MAWTRLVPRRSAAKASRSRISRSAWRRPLAGRHHVLDPVAEEERTDPVLLPRAGQRQHRRHLDRASRLGDRRADPGRSRTGPPRAGA